SGRAGRLRPRAGCRCAWAALARYVRPPSSLPGVVGSTMWAAARLGKPGDLAGNPGDAHVIARLVGRSLMQDTFSRDAALVRNGFVNKIKAVARRIPFAEDAVAAWFCTRDPATPFHVRATLIGALAYFVMPFDVIPDFVA